MNPPNEATSTTGSAAGDQQATSLNVSNAFIACASGTTANNVVNNANKTSGPTSSTNSVTSATNSTPFFPLTRSRTRENLDSQEMIDINNIEEPQGTHESSYKARFCPNKLKEEEFAIFNNFENFTDESDEDNQILKAYLYIRDRILEQWFANVQIELTRETAYLSLENEKLDQIPPETKDKLFNYVFSFLDRTGRINFGILPFRQNIQPNQVVDRTKRAPHMTSHLYKPPLKPTSKRTGRVIVLGAGLSGLTAARQLQRFGLEVIVIEARNRVGGRVHTYRKGNFIADLGPSSLNGVVGNPVVCLGKQLDLVVMELKQKIPIYEIYERNGQNQCVRFNPLLERAVEREYNKIMEGTRVMKNNYKIEKYRGEPFPVGTLVDWVMKLQEKNIKDDQMRHLKSIDNFYQQLIDSANTKLEKARIIKKLHGQLCSIKDSTDLGNHKDKGAIDTFTRRCLARDLDLALKEYKLLVEQETEIHNKIESLLRNPPSDTYLSLTDRRLLDWHFAELEYALGCPINKLGIYYEDDEEIFEGSHWMLVHGFNTIVEAMKQDLDIQLGTAVKKIQIGKNSCRVFTYQPDHASSPYVEYTADAVLCTLPLGVLQDSVVASQQAAADQTQIKYENSRTTHKGYQPLIISPPLPKWKTQALSRLGCGNLNKIVLHFDKIFWETELHLFGAVDHKAISRGEFFLFWHHGRTPTLTGLISGEAADSMEKLSDLEILERCLRILRSVCGNSVPAPKDYVVTKWRKDPWARGAWSYLLTGATGDDYDGCAEPVVLSTDEQNFKETRLSQANVKSQKNFLVTKVKSTEDIPRLFFAGEHTTRHHFASAHGAVLTGLREAGRIANIFLGCPYYDDDEPGIIVS